MRRNTVVFLAVIYFLGEAHAETKSFSHSNEHMHTHYASKSKLQQRNYDVEEETASFWYNKAEATLKKLLDNKHNTGKAKNVIMFLGDGMSIPTLAATRVYLGHKNKKPGEETVLSFEEFPHTALSKTYCVDGTVADSACSATAYLGGVKANDGTIGVTAAVALKDCTAMANETNHVHSIARLFQSRELRTGVVTTTRITHASPAGVYAHTAFRDWECDSDIKNDGENPEKCRDIAHQLVHGEVGKNLNVIFGGGRRGFIPKDKKDDDGLPGLRSDKRDLIQEWKDIKTKASVEFDVVYNRDQFNKLEEGKDYVLGLFANDHMDYRLDMNIKQPRLVEMTKKAIELLSKDKNGFFLFVEGGRIDHAHHDNFAKKALEETVEFHEAIKAAVSLVDIKETLIVVTADHAHTMSVNGYPQRGSDILGLSAANALDDLPYATISYANGPSYKAEVDGARHDLRKDKISDKNYMFPALVPLKDETHGGDDVGIYAIGPWSHLYAGVIEQNVIPHIMTYASCVKRGVDNACSASTRSVLTLSLLLLPLFVVFRRNIL